MKQMTLQQIAQACGGKLVCPQGQTVPDTEAACVVIDSRQIEQDGVFIATPFTLIIAITSPTILLG